MTKLNIDEKTKDLLISLNVYSIPINVKKIAKKLNITIDYEDLDDHIDGYLLKKDGSTNIGINKFQPSVRQRFTISHEIGHYSLHSNVPLFVDSYKGSIYRSKGMPQNYEMERQANIFAASLLMPKDLIYSELNKIDDEIDYDSKKSIMATTFNVSQAAMDYRLRDLGYYDYGF